MTTPTRSTHTPGMTEQTKAFRSFFLDFEERAKHYGRLDRDDAADYRTEDYLSAARVAVLDEVESVVATLKAERDSLDAAYRKLDVRFNVMSVEYAVTSAERDELLALVQKVAERYEFEQEHLAELKPSANADGSPRTWFHIDHALGQQARALLATLEL